jgi:hypothetical protein
MHQRTRARRLASLKQRVAVEDVIICTKHRGEMIDLDLTTEIGVGGDFTERKFTFGAAATTFDVNLFALKADTFE